MSTTNIAINGSEGELLSFSGEILKILLTDRTTRRNIIWATSDYESYGDSFKACFPITINQITGSNALVIQPRIAKAKNNQNLRTKEKAEVFTPAWVCNEQNNLIDSAWFGRESIFNVTHFKGWKTNDEPIPFSDKKGHRWQDYVDEKRLEITCGEAPYLTSRYDMLTGETIDIKDRIGLLDRKLRVVSENVDEETSWIKWVYRAYESIYGFEFQGDNLLLARENLLFTFIENTQHKLNRDPVYSELKRAATIISWNVWQMDGLSFTVPFRKVTEQYKQLTLDDICSEQHETEKNVYCKIHDWRSKETVLFRSLVEQRG